MTWLAISRMRLPHTINDVSFSREDAEFTKKLEQLYTWFSVRKLPRLRVVDARITPLLWTWWNDVTLIVPRSLFSSLSSSQQEMLLSHALALLLHRDHLSPWLEATVRSLYLHHGTPARRSWQRQATLRRDLGAPGARPEHGTTSENSAFRQTQRRRIPDFETTSPPGDSEFGISSCSMTVDVHGPLVRLDDKRILAFDRASTRTSSDAGNTWSRPRAVFADPKKHKAASPDLIRTHEGVLILTFVNEGEMVWKWNNQRRNADPNTTAPTCVTRSLDDGRTWDTWIELSGTDQLHSPSQDQLGWPFVNCGDSQGLAGDQRFVESGCPEQKSSGFR